MLAMVRAQNPAFEGLQARAGEESRYGVVQGCRGEALHVRVEPPVGVCGLCHHLEQAPDGKLRMDRDLQTFDRNDADPTLRDDDHLTFRGWFEAGIEDVCEHLLLIHREGQWCAPRVLSQV